MKLFVKITLALLLSVAGPTVTEAAEQLVDGIVAIVGSEIILSSEVNERMAAQKGKFSSKKKQTRSEILEEIINDKLLLQEIERLKIEVSDQEADQALRGILAQNQVTLSQLKSELSKKGIPYAAYKKDLLNRIRLMKFMRQNIYGKIEIDEKDFVSYKTRFPSQSKKETEEQMRMNILEAKSRDLLKEYLSGVRQRSFVEIKDNS